MARTVAEIESSITGRLQEAIPNLSTSSVAAWRLMAFVVAMSIHSFEVILDLFRDEIGKRVMISRVGTRTWYEQICYAFQIGHSLVYDPVAVTLTYAADDAAARIIAAVSVNEPAPGGIIAIRVAKRDPESGDLIALTADELTEFKAYINLVKMAGTRTSVTSVNADRVRYEVAIYHDGTQSTSVLQAAVDAALAEFKQRQVIGGVLYRQRFADILMHLPGVVSVNVASFEFTPAYNYEGNGYTMWRTIAVGEALEAGYFNYATNDSNITFLLA